MLKLCSDYAGIANSLTLTDSYYAQIYASIMWEGLAIYSPVPISISSSR